MQQQVQQIMQELCGLSETLLNTPAPPARQASAQSKDAALPVAKAGETTKARGVAQAKTRGNVRGHSDLQRKNTAAGSQYSLPLNEY